MLLRNSSPQSMLKLHRNSEIRYSKQILCWTVTNVKQEFQSYLAKHLKKEAITSEDTAGKAIELMGPEK